MTTRSSWQATQRWLPASWLWMLQSSSPTFTWWIVPRRSTGEKSYRQITTSSCSSIVSLSFMARKSVYSIRSCRWGWVLTRLNRYWSTILSRITQRRKTWQILGIEKWATFGLKLWSSMRVQVTNLTRLSNFGRTIIAKFSTFATCMSTTHQTRCPSMSNTLPHMTISSETFHLRKMSQGKHYATRF